MAKVLSSRLELAQVTLNALRRNLYAERYFMYDYARSNGHTYRLEVIHRIVHAHPILNINRSQDKYAIY